VYPVLPAGQARIPPGAGFGFGRGFGVVSGTVGSGAVGSVPVVIVGVTPLVVAGPSVTLAPVSTATLLPPEPPRPSSTATAVAAAAMTRKRRAGQIQSPGYHRRRRCQPEARTPTRPRFTGRRAPHSRQYSCSGS